MKQNTDSDYNPTMVASFAFETIIDNIRNSNLNFQLQISPFSAQISLKRSPVTEKTGVPRLPATIPASTFPKKDVQLESEVNYLKVEYARVVGEWDEAQARIKCLEAEVERLSIKPENDDVNIAKIEELQVKLKGISTENIRYIELLKEQKEEIHDLKNSVKIRTDVSNEINKKFSEYRIKCEKENAVAKKSHQNEIKSWKKQLGYERKQKTKLESKLEKLIGGNITKEYSENKIISTFPKNSPVCENCDETFKADESKPVHNICQHGPQCVIRQPYPPPSPCSPFIVHEVSKYHEHMMNKTVDDMIGCIKCFSVDNENYGCDKCTWLKWWFKWHGERHGFPDINPAVYKKYQ